MVQQLPITYACRPTTDACTISAQIALGVTSVSCLRTTETLLASHGSAFIREPRFLYLPTNAARSVDSLKTAAARLGYTHGLQRQERARHPNCERYVRSSVSSR